MANSVMFTTKICYVVIWLVCTFGNDCCNAKITIHQPHHHHNHHNHKHEQDKHHPKFNCSLTTFGMVFPNETHHHSFAYRNISEFIGKMYFCAWIYPTNEYVTLLDVARGRHVVLQVEADLTKEPPRIYIRWQKKVITLNAKGLKPFAWSHVCFQGTKLKKCHLYINNEKADSVHCQATSGWLNGSAMLGQKTDPKTGKFIDGASFSGILAAVQMTRIDVQMGLQNTDLACMYKQCEKKKRVFPGDKSNLLYWPVSLWTLRDLSLKQFEVPCALHNTDFILNKPNEIDKENNLMDWEHDQRVKMRLAKMGKLILK